MNDRRPLKTRQYDWAHKLAHFFVRCGVTPNAMSLASIALALGGAYCYWASEKAPVLYLILAAAFIQLRLLSNMLDGLMAVEEGRKTPTGALYNEVPDRFADIIFLVAAGYITPWPWLGWTASLLAVLTAYVRVLGGALGQAQDFSGPMAKPHRMFTLTVGTLVSACLPQLPILAITLTIIGLGSALTLFRRIRHIAAKLKPAAP